MSAEIKTAVREFLTENFMFRATGEIADDASLMKAGILDSAGILSLIAFLEEKFEIKVDDAEVDPANMESIDAITAFVVRKTGKA
jgi:acyl carrier protein